MSRGIIVVPTAGSLPPLAGNAGKYLTTDGSSAYWAGSITKTSSYTATLTDGTAFLDASSNGIVVTLPAASSSAGARLTFSKIDSTVTGIAIGATNSTYLATQGESVTIQSDGTAWRVASRYIPSNWTNFTMTIGATTTAPAKPTTRTEVARWRRIGPDAEVEYQISYTSASGGTIGSGTYTYSLPSGLTLDTASKPYNAWSNPQVSCGTFRLIDANNVGSGNVVIYSPTQFVLYGKFSTAGASATSITDFAQGSAAFGFTDSTLSISFTARVPIVSWNYI